MIIFYLKKSEFWYNNRMKSKHKYVDLCIQNKTINNRNISNEIKSKKITTVYNCQARVYVAVYIFIFMMI